MERIIIKVYAALSPADAVCAESIRLAGTQAVHDSGESWLFYEPGLLRISFEGLYFPEHEVLAALESCLPARAQGKMDVLDLELWELRRYARKDGKFRLSRRDLNHVLDHSGH